MKRKKKQMKFKYVGGKWNANSPTIDTKTDIGYGIYDTVDNCWLGDGEGPVLYGELLIARVSAQVQGVMLGYAPTRLEHRLYEYKPVRLRDTVDTKMDALTALKLIEEGGAV